jgi:serine/threonine protein phosphatase PrpC
MTDRLRAVAAGITDVGLQRDHNEDSFAILDELELFVVADGMGGHRAGDVASQLATHAISEFFRNTDSPDATWPYHFDARLTDEENRLLSSIRVANRQILERSNRSQECRGMGTTVVAVLFAEKDQRAYIVHVGDSRAYRVRNRQIEQLTRDHSLVNDYLLAMPELTEDQRSELPKNVITRALGMQEHVAIDLQHTEVHEGDLFVLCSDGLSGMIDDEEMLEVVNRSEDLSQACRELVAMANEHGGEDNITAVLIRFEEASVDAERRTWPAFGDQSLGAPGPSGSASSYANHTPPGGVAVVSPDATPPDPGRPPQS